VKLLQFRIYNSNLREINVRIVRLKTSILFYSKVETSTDVLGCFSNLMKSDSNYVTFALNSYTKITSDVSSYNLVCGPDTEEHHIIKQVADRRRDVWV